MTTLPLLFIYFSFYSLPQNLQKFYLVFSYSLSDSSHRMHPFCGLGQFTLLVTPSGFF